MPILITGIPQHTIIHCTGYTALLKTLHNHFCREVLPCCYDSLGLNTTFIFIGLEHLNPRSFTILSTDDVSGVRNLKYMCSEFLWFLISVLVQVLFLSLAVHILTNYCFYGVQWLRIVWSTGSTRLGISLPENGNKAIFCNICASLKSSMEGNVPRKDCVS